MHKYTEYNLKEKRKKIISIDLDGVLNTYCGNYEKDKIPSIKDGAYEFLKELATQYDIEIYTVREKWLCEKWLKENNLSEFVKNISDKKNHYASIYLDDRALTFDGSYENAFKKITSFKPHWK